MFSECDQRELNVLLTNTILDDRKVSKRFPRIFYCDNTFFVIMIKIRYFCYDIKNIDIIVPTSVLKMSI